jgi:hypothetical protein
MALIIEGGSYGDGLTEVLNDTAGGADRLREVFCFITLVDGFATLAPISCILSSGVESALAGLPSCHEDERSGIHARQAEN